MPVCFKMFLAYTWEHVYETKDDDGTTMYIFAHTEEEFYKELKKFKKFEEFIEKNTQEFKLIEEPSGRTRLC